MCCVLGVDPKSILCQFFKAGTCQKGAKCKFSHDIDVERKAEKIDLYSDQRKDKADDGKAGGTWGLPLGGCLAVALA
jgi:hypothetical protein